MPRVSAYRRTGVEEDHTERATLRRYTDTPTPRYNALLWLRLCRAVTL